MDAGFVGERDHDAQGAEVRGADVEPAQEGAAGDGGEPPLSGDGADVGDAEAVDAGAGGLHGRRRAPCDVDVAVVDGEGGAAADGRGARGVEQDGERRDGRGASAEDRGLDDDVVGAVAGLVAAPDPEQGVAVDRRCDGVAVRRSGEAEVRGVEHADRARDAGGADRAEARALVAVAGHQLDVLRPGGVPGQSLVGVAGGDGGEQGRGDGPAVQGRLLDGVGDAVLEGRGRPGHHLGREDDLHVLQDGQDVGDDPAAEGAPGGVQAHQGLAVGVRGVLDDDAADGLAVAVQGRRVDRDHALADEQRAEDRDDRVEGARGQLVDLDRAEVGVERRDELVVGLPGGSGCLVRRRADAVGVHGAHPHVDGRRGVAHRQQCAGQRRDVEAGAADRADRGGGLDVDPGREGREHLVGLGAVDRTPRGPHRADREGHRSEHRRLVRGRAPRVGRLGRGEGVLPDERAVAGGGLAVDGGNAPAAGLGLERDGLLVAGIAGPDAEELDLLVLQVRLHGAALAVVEEHRGDVVGRRRVHQDLRAVEGVLDQAGCDDEVVFLGVPVPRVVGVGVAVDGQSAARLVELGAVLDLQHRGAGGVGRHEGGADVALDDEGDDAGLGHIRPFR